MFIQNQTFSDREMLLEVLFDFELGEHTEVIQKMKAAIEIVLQEDVEYQNELQKLEDAEDCDEFADEVKREFLVNMLGEKFARFEVKDRKWYGLDAQGEKTLLGEVDLV